MVGITRSKAIFVDIYIYGSLFFWGFRVRLFDKEEWEKQNKYIYIYIILYIIYIFPFFCYLSSGLVNRNGTAL